MSKKTNSTKRYICRLQKQINTLNKALDDEIENVSYFQNMLDDKVEAVATLKANSIPRDAKTLDLLQSIKARANMAKIEYEHLGKAVEAIGMANIYRDMAFKAETSVQIIPTL